MEIINFLKLLNRRKFILIIIPLITVIITYFLVRQLPNSYISKSRIATGLVEQSEQVIDNLSFLQESKIDQEFNNIQQIMQLKKIYDQVSYQLILHDLLKPDSAFRKPSSLMRDLNKSAVQHAIEVYTRLYENAEPLVLWDTDQNGLKQVLVSMGYDEESLKKKMLIYRVNRSDFIDVEFQSENPVLSAFVVNQLTQEFIKYYSSATKNNQIRSVAFLDSLRRDKEATLNSNMDALKSYKIQNRILNMQEQAKVLYGQIADMETKLEVARKDMDGYKGVIKNIESKFDPNDRQFIQSTTRKINQDIVASTNQLKSLTDLYIRNNYDSRYKTSIDSLKNQIAAQINESADRYTLSPLTTKENLVIQKINAEVSLDMAKFSITSLEKEILRLNNVVNDLVPHEANIQAFEEKIDVAGREYLDALNKFNQASLTSSISVRIRQIEVGMPGAAVPSKKMLLVILSGVISFGFCILVLFILFYIDTNIRSARELANQTSSPVLGVIPFMGNEAIDLKRMWNGEYDIIRTESYKNMIRSVRFEISERMGQEKILAITSARPLEGKTFAAMNIAYAYSRIGRRVLLIDGHFEDPVLSHSVGSSSKLEDFLKGGIAPEQLRSDKYLTILASKGGDLSLFELSDPDTIKKRIQELTRAFDLVLIDAPSLEELGKTKEWVAVSDKVLAVFEAGQSLQQVEALHMQYLQSLGNKFIGWLMNKEIIKKKKKGLF
jgi:uncharacterized protein involved in exopolysaccharide biosynthesis/Mrp family chromosome partitioning ATPase